MSGIQGTIFPTEPSKGGSGNTTETSQLQRAMSVCEAMQFSSMGALANASYVYCPMNSLVSENMSFCYFLFLGDQGMGCGGEFYMTICNADSLKLYFGIWQKFSKQGIFGDRGFCIISDFDCQFQTASRRLQLGFQIIIQGYSARALVSRPSLLDK